MLNFKLKTIKLSQLLLKFGALIQTNKFGFHDNKYTYVSSKLFKSYNF